MNRAQKSGPRSVLAMTRYRHEGALQEALGARWRVQRVTRTEEVLWRLRSSAFAALILHVDDSSQDTLEAVARHHPAVPVIALVEAGEEPLAAWALAHGAAGYVCVGPALSVLLDPVLDGALRAAHLRSMQSRALELEHREQLTALAQVVRHEINNPLTGILGSAEMALKSPELTADLRRRLANIVRLTEEIRSLLQQLEQIHENPARLLELAQQ